jgi:TPR repeat protein
MFSLAAKQGYPLAQYALGNMFYNGEGGIQDYRQAKQMYELAANQNNHDAQHMLGIIYYEGMVFHKTVKKLKNFLI